MSRRWWTLVAVSLATFMTYSDNNVTNVAIPTIQRSLHLSVSGLEWVVSSYLLVFAALLLAGGRLADHYGRRRLFLLGLGIFTAASLAAGLAGNGAVLIASRAVQGLGAALLVPATLAIVMATFTDPRERTQAVGIWTATGALALAVGPLIGGLISQHLHWGWIFFINVPVGVITAAIALRTMAESRGGRADARRRLDVPGLAISAVMLFALVYALIEGQDRGWTSPLIIGSFALCRPGPGRLPGRGAPDRGPDGRPVDLPLAGLLRRHGDHDAVGLRGARDLLLHRALPAERAGLLADQGRAGLRPHGPGRGGVLRAGCPDRGPGAGAPCGGGRHAADGGRPRPVHHARPAARASPSCCPGSWSSARAPA